MNTKKQPPATVDAAWAAVQGTLNERAELNAQARAWFAEHLRMLMALKQALVAEGLVEDDDG